MSAEDDHAGPSVDSEDPEERIMARRLRIQRRQEAQKRALLGENKDESKDVEQFQSGSQKQIEESYVRTRKLHEDGFEMVTNIRVAGDAREIARRIEEEEAKRQRKEKLEAEAKAGAERFDEITKKWELSLQKEIPQDLHEMLTQQKSACDAMLDEKNKLITDYQAELKAKDDQYVRDLKKQAEDIDLLIERMENQIKELTKAYRHELEEIEKSFVMERTEMLERQNKKWEQMMVDRRHKEIDYMAERERRVEDFEQQLQHLRVQDAEEYNQVKIKLETDVQILQQQLQQMKATYQLNQEKLEYNFQVLRKRDEENTITKSQQKRKITRLHDVLTNLKRKLAKQEKSYRGDNEQLTADYKHQLDQFKDIQRKAKTFMASDAKKFNEIWLMNEEECKNLAQHILEADRIIHEQQLGLEWIRPDLEFMNNVGPIVTDKGKSTTDKSAQKLVQQVLTADHETSSQEDQQQQQQSEAADETSVLTDAVGGTGTQQPPSTSAAVAGNFTPRLIKQILELICDESGFLIESKLLTLLAPLNPCEQMLMKLDAIFVAMGVESEEDVQTLTRYFLKFRSTDNNKLVPPVPSPQTGDAADEPMQMGIDADICDELNDSCVSKLQDDRDTTGATVGSSVADNTDIVSDKAGSQPELVSANDVLKALRAFVEENNRQRSSQKSQMSSQFTIVNVNERDDSEDAAYWANYQHIVTDEKEKVWDALIYSFDKYYEVLTARAKLLEETDSLRQQNAELRLLLHQYVNSKVNQELEVPPTRILQLN
jgi:dynein regulatory complex protein 1